MRAVLEIVFSEYMNVRQGNEKENGKSRRKRKKVVFAEDLEHHRLPRSYWDDAETVSKGKFVNLGALFSRRFFRISGSGLLCVMSAEPHSTKLDYYSTIPRVRKSALRKTTAIQDWRLIDLSIF